MLLDVLALLVGVGEASLFTRGGGGGGGGGKGGGEGGRGGGGGCEECSLLFPRNEAST